MIRLFVGEDLSVGAEIGLPAEQTHYLVNVMRQGIGDGLRLFNGRDGEWAARITAIGKRNCSMRVETLDRPQRVGPDLELVVALVKRPRLETIVEKAAELGARRVRLVTTERTNSDRANLDRLSAIATEAAEQTGRLDVPEVIAPARLDRLLGAWLRDRRLMFCDEAGDAEPVWPVLSSTALDFAPRLGGNTGEAPRGGRPRTAPWAILIGPEGGFSAAERTGIRAVPGAVAVSLGPRILRSDTAAICAMTLWQAAIGDWRGLEVASAAPQVNVDQGGTSI